MNDNSDVKLKVKLKNCYGIRELNHTFEFSEKERISVIYASNGTMKTSFSKTFLDLSMGNPSKDQIFETESSREIKFKNQIIDKEEVLVIKSYEDNYQFSDETYQLLASPKLKEEYQTIQKDINSCQEPFIEELKLKFGKRKEMDCILSFTDDIINERNNDRFFDALENLESEIEKNVNVNDFSHLKYVTLFNDKVEKILKNEEFQKSLLEYITRYDQLIENSDFFEVGIFDHNNLESIKDNIKGNNLFKGKNQNKLVIGKNEFKSDKELQDAIEKEKNIILSDSNLKKLFEDINKLLNRNAELKAFSKCIKENRSIIPKLKDYKFFKRNIWISYLSKNIESFQKLLSVYKQNMKEMKRIESEIEKEKAKWHEIIEIFNSRFQVPFEIRIKNRKNVTLKNEKPELEFSYKENNKPTNRQDLERILSQGEKRALYLLHVIFDIETRKDIKKKTLFIIDDIADSFDYQNKYAIIEYLQDISQEEKFYQIILTHNYDFFRTICSRINIKKCLRLLSERKDNRIVLNKSPESDPFNDWKKNKKDCSKFIALIPFFRNLADYSSKTCISNKLTCLLHIKANTKDIQVGELVSEFQKQITDFSFEGCPEATKVYDLIFSEADNEKGNINNLEKKIVFSIAIRLKAEEFMIGKLNNKFCSDKITKNQTRSLFDKVGTIISSHERKVLGKVILMTPEHIHLNSFMYEPLIDMSSDALKKLYEDCKGLFKYKGN